MGKLAYLVFYLKNRHFRLIKYALCSKCFVGIGYLLLIMFLSSCSAGQAVHNTVLQTGNAPESKYSIVCIIHGDGDYLYHDTSGNEFKADEVALAGVKRVAEQNPNAEVFIFHQKPTRHFLLLFPQHDGEFYYYKNGRLIANELYWREREQSQINPEIELYRRFHSENLSRMINMFIYLGHEIPEFGGTGYDESYADRSFSIPDLASELKDFMPDSSRFDLVILSTCFGGTPYTIRTLGVYTRTIIASPDNLHLSYFNLSSLEHLDNNLKDRNDVLPYAKRFAQNAFDRLTSDVQTAVSVVVYDVDRTQEYLNSVHSIYDTTLAELKNEAQTSLPLAEHCDCAELPDYVTPTMNEGVSVFYRPARFGRSKNKQSHSGWECRREIKPQSSTKNK
jgi:hypothetical protein